MSRPRLSICIATLNRAKFLGETLESIISQSTDEVEIVVVDGASTDHTGEIVQQYRERSRNFRYVRLEQKGGVDQDYCRAVELAVGEYCWLFTDDDLFKPGAISAVLAATRSQPSLIVVNAEVRTKDFTVQLASSRVNVEADQTYVPTEADRDRLMAEVGNYLSFVGGVIIERSLWSARDKSAFLGTEFVHAGVIFQAPLPSEAKLLVYPWVTIRYGNAQWVARHFEIWMIKWPNLIWSAPGVADWAKAKVVPREPLRDWRRLLLDRAMGRFGREEYVRTRKIFQQSRGLAAIACAIAHFPIRPLNILACWYVIHVARKNPSIALFDLEDWRRRH